MGRKEITAELSARLIHYIDPHFDPRIYWAREVTFDYATMHTVRVDFMRFKPENNSVSGIERGSFYCYEVKSSVEDFHSKNGHNLIGDYNYYVMPEDVFAKIGSEVHYYAGVLVPDGPDKLKVVRRAKRMDRIRSCHEMLFMMMRSAARDMDRRKIPKMPEQSVLL